MKWQAKRAEEEKKDKRGEKFSSGLIDLQVLCWWVKSIHVRLEFGQWNTFIKQYWTAGALLFSQTLHLDALDLCGMV